MRGVMRVAGAVALAVLLARRAASSRPRPQDRLPAVSSTTPAPYCPASTVDVTNVATEPDANDSHRRGRLLLRSAPAAGYLPRQRHALRLQDHRPRRACRSRSRAHRASTCSWRSAASKRRCQCRRPCRWSRLATPRSASSSTAADRRAAAERPQLHAAGHAAAGRHRATQGTTGANGLGGSAGDATPGGFGAATSGFSVNGMRNQSNNFLLDGASNNDTFNTGFVLRPPPDAIQEFKILTHSYGAEYGRNAGSVVNVVTRSGTNELHGAAWEFNRDDALQARNYFAAAGSAEAEAEAEPVRRQASAVRWPRTGCSDSATTRASATRAASRRTSSC